MALHDREGGGKVDLAAVLCGHLGELLGAISASCSGSGAPGNAAVASLFDHGAVLVAGSLVTGPKRVLAELSKLGYVATTRTVTVRHDTAVVVSDQAVNVSVRTPHGAWRLVATIVRPRTSND